mmetsp:Transcript_1400/g.1510  ORF Transcript_1400/g.1510 Transcript_1400/m.1510 type:complete len:128 (+) Transcript_1400:52-435(+)|eukprot:CAMPEP_0198251166 /NCGR_PEP_ID=MMETSP1447-20131203/2089_1 /TAXON_ID=420782 /ORGANISM="Chaetoceros dichaeta, Strain CCMP1751" /LENGTH=127 /DNA_ID=CAMNT_0043936127 /DNA_START=45 /DNA_END=428 /DNA_ORIENTATION=-
MAESNTTYVAMGGAGKESLDVGSGSAAGSGLDSNLSQEDKDRSLALALQQQENDAAYDDSKRKHDRALARQNLKTGRSCVGAIPPQARLARTEDAAEMVEKIVKTDAALNASSQTRNARSGHAAFKK